MCSSLPVSFFLDLSASIIRTKKMPAQRGGAGPALSPLGGVWGVGTQVSLLIEAGRPQRFARGVGHGSDRAGRFGAMGRREHDDLGANLHPRIEIDHVIVDHADAA